MVIKISIELYAKSSFTLYWILHTSHKISVCPQSQCCEFACKNVGRRLQIWPTQKFWRGAPYVTALFTYLQYTGVQTLGDFMARLRSSVNLHAGASWRLFLWSPLSDSWSFHWNVFNLFGFFHASHFTFHRSAHRAHYGWRTLTRCCVVTTVTEQGNQINTITTYLASVHISGSVFNVNFSLFSSVSSVFINV